MLISFLKVFAVALLLAYLGLLGMALWLAPRLLFPVPEPGYGANDESFAWLTLDGGNRIACRYFPNPEASRVILYHHGNAEDLAGVESRLQALQAHGFAVFAYDYPGYGRSSGQPSERGILAAAEAARAQLVGPLGWEAGQLIHFGHSLGGGPAIAMGARHPSGGVVVEATFTGVFRVLTRVRLLPWELFDNLARVRRLQAPLLVLHGRQDSTVPFWHGEALAAAGLDSSHLWVDDAHHVNLWEVAGERFWKALDDFAHSPEQP